MIAAVPISETVLDRGVFMPNAKQITGMNHVTDVDAHPGLSRLADDMSILKDFASQFCLESSIMFMGFLVVGHAEEVDEFVSWTRGMAYVETSDTERGIRCVAISGSIADWQRVIIEGNRCTLERSSQRRVWNDIYRVFTQKGLGHLFSDFSPVERDGVLLLECK